MEALDILLITLGIICMISGLTGCFIPVIPGTPLCYIGILLLHFTTAQCFSVSFLLGWAAVTIVIQLLDYVIPAIGTKKFGGGKGGTIGCTVGVVASIFFFAPASIIVFPFLGAVAGELLSGKDFAQALRAGFGSFLGFLAGVLLKLIASLVMLFYFAKACFDMIF